MLVISNYIIIFFILVSILWLAKLCISHIYLKKLRIDTNEEEHRSQQEICIIIPVLEEVTRLPNTIENFIKLGSSWDKLRIMIVTTEKEYYSHNKTNESYITQVKNLSSNEEIFNVIVEILPDLIRKVDRKLDIKEYKKSVINLIKKRPNSIQLATSLSIENDNVITFHMPNSEGKMAHQVNFGVNEYIKKYSSKDVLFALYNADSNPDKRTLKWVVNRRAESKKRGINEIYQQYGVYLGNHLNLAKQGVIKSAILTSAGMWQTRWSLGVEVFNTIRQFKLIKGFNNYATTKLPILNYCIGHGLFFDYKIFEKFNGFSEHTHNEDAIFGIQASLFKIPIIPVPYFEMSDSPETIKSLYIQKSTWFMGPLQSFKYYKQLVLMYNLKFKEKISLFWLVCCNYEYALRWVFIPLFYFFLLLIVLLDLNFIKIMLFIFISILYLTIPSILGYYLCAKNGSNSKIKFRTIIFAAIIGSPIMFLMHGLSGIRMLKNIIISKVRNKELKKERTPLKGLTQ